MGTRRCLLVGTRRDPSAGTRREVPAGTRRQVLAGTRRNLQTWSREGVFQTRNVDLHLPLFDWSSAHFSQVRTDERRSHEPCAWSCLAFAVRV